MKILIYLCIGLIIINCQDETKKTNIKKTKKKKNDLPDIKLNEEKLVENKETEKPKKEKEIEKPKKEVKEENEKPKKQEKVKKSKEKNNKKSKSELKKEKEEFYKKDHFIDRFSILVKYELDVLETKIFNFDITKETNQCEFDLNIFVSNSNQKMNSNSMYNLSINDPNNKSIFELSFNKKSENKQTRLNFNVVGTYVIHVKNEESDTKIIEMEFGLNKCHYIPKKMGKEHLIDIKEKFSEKISKVHNLIEQTNFLETREIYNLEQNENLFDNVLYSSIIECSVICVISIWQILFLKKLLNNKQII